MISDLFSYGGGRVLSLSSPANLMPRAARVVYDVLRDAATSTAAGPFGQLDYGGGQLFGFGAVASGLAFVMLAAYTLACFVLPVFLTWRRDIV